MIRVSGTNHSWSLTLSSAKELLKAGKQPDAFWFPYFVGSMVLSVASFEAFLNSLGATFKSDTQFTEYEKLCPLDKCFDLEAHTGVKVDKSRAPFQTINDAIKWRNALMHAKPVEYTDQPFDSPKDMKTFNDSVLKDCYELKVTEENARAFHEAICQVMNTYMDAVKLVQSPNLRTTQ